jgi:hypothetical protein
VKRVIFLVVIASMLTACMGNTSLWGQYQTPTPPGGIPTIVNSPAPDVVTAAPDVVTFVADVFVPLPSETPIIQNTVTATSLLNTFVTEPATSTPEPPTPTFASDTILYYSQSGDWLPEVASRFGVSLSEIASPKMLPEKGFIDQGTLLIIPDRIDRTVEYTAALQLMPDSEVVYSATALDFDIEEYVKNAGGYMASYREYLGTTGWTSGAKGIKRLAYENSINPRLLLAVLDYEAQWVRGQPISEFRKKYPMGYESYLNVGMFGQLTWAINQLSTGYYGWRQGSLHELTFLDGKTLQLDPNLNAGTVAVMVLFSRLHTWNEWLRIMDQTSGFPAFYQIMFGDPWSRANRITSFFPPNLTQPEMMLPFEPNVTWSFTGGPHSAWGTDVHGPQAALDFAPRTDTTGCYDTTSWIVAMAPGLVVRSDKGVVVIDMDGDGHEQTGWNIMYLHVAGKERVALGEWVDMGARIGHASCEGGISTGTHTHIARKYNGEWMLADGPVPFILSGWIVVSGEKPYLGKLVKGNNVITADVYGQSWSLITREDGE